MGKRLDHAIASKKGGDILCRYLADHPDITKVEIARRCDVSFQTVWRWSSGRGFGPDQRRMVAAAFDLPATYFEEPGDVGAREERRAATLRAFLQTDYGRTATAVERAQLDAFQFPIAQYRPTVAFYELMLGMLRGAVLGSADETAAVNEQLDANLASAKTLKKTSTKRPKSQKKRAPKRGH